MMNVKKSIAKQWLVVLAGICASLAYGGIQFYFQHNARTQLDRMDLTDEADKFLAFSDFIQRSSKSEVVSIEDWDNNTLRIIARLADGRTMIIDNGKAKERYVITDVSKLRDYIALKQVAKLDIWHNIFTCFVAVYISLQVILVTWWSMNVVRRKRLS